jgi:hypothetical protein
MELNEILENIDEKKNTQTSIIKKYLSVYLVELAEIIFQLKNEYKLAAFKIRKDITPGNKFIFIFKELVKKTFIFFCNNV